MSGTKAGGQKTAATNLRKYGHEFYVNIGRKGGRNSHMGGFASTKKGKDGLTGPERARILGAIGGRRSRRGPAKPTEVKLARRYYGIEE